METMVTATQIGIDFLMRNRRFIGAVLFIVGLALRAVTMPCSWCHGGAEFCMAAGAYIHGTGLNTSDRNAAIKQAIRDGDLPERRAGA